MEEERYNEISNDEAVIKLVGKISMEYPELFLKNLQQQIKLKEIIEEGLYEYDVVTRCKELITSDLDENFKYPDEIFTFLHEPNNYYSVLLS